MPFTDILTGTLINIKKAKAFSLQEHLKFEMEADFLLRLTAASSCGEPGTFEL